MRNNREMHILNTLAQLRFVTTNQIHQLHGYSGSYGMKVTRRKLYEMERSGLIKSWQPSRYNQKIYYLSKHGAVEMEYHGGAAGTKIYKKSEKSIHQTWITEVFVGLKKAESGTLRICEAG